MGISIPNTIIITGLGVGAGVAMLATFLAFQATEKDIQQAMGEIRSDLDDELLKLPNGNLTDSQLIEKSRDFDEVKFLLVKYPDADASVLRYYEQGLDFRNIFVTHEVVKYVADTNDTSLRKMKLVVGFDRISPEVLGIGFGCEGPDSSTLPQYRNNTAMTNLQNEACFQ